MRELLARLTEVHTIEIVRDDGSTFHAYADPLLAQLRVAIHGEHQPNGGGGSSPSSRLPLNAPAADLYREIDEHIAEVWAREFDSIPNADKPEVLLAAWAARVEPTAFVIYHQRQTVETTLGHRIEEEPVATTAIEFLTHITDKIVALLERPTVAVPVVGPCPAEGCWRSETRLLIDGEESFRPVLEFIREQRTGRTLAVRCRACDAEWNQSQFRAFAEALAAAERDIVHRPARATQLA